MKKNYEKKSPYFLPDKGKFPFSAILEGQLELGLIGSDLVIIY